MRILVNTSVLHKGGSMTTAVAFLMEAMRTPSGHEWHFAVSSQVANELRGAAAHGLQNVEVFATSPARFKSARRELLEIEARIRPDCVFTFFGPAYVKFRPPHLLGFATPWVTHATWLAYRTKSFPFGWISTSLSSCYKAAWFRFADAWVTETNASCAGLQRRLGLSPDRMFVVPNSCGRQYFDNQEISTFPSKHEKIRLVSFAAAYPHKRLEFLPYVAKELAARDSRLDFEFVITLPKCVLLRKIDRISKRLGVTEHVTNVGPIHHQDGPDLYRTCHICFVPSVLETFSATYPEAMAMGLPIVTTDLEFARDVCGPAAIYFRPNYAPAAADAILKVLGDHRVWDDCIEQGKAQLSQLPTPREKFEAYLELIIKLGLETTENVCRASKP